MKPAAGEEKVGMMDVGNRGCLAFSLIVDVDKAYWQLEIPQKDWGMIACKLCIDGITSCG